VAEKEYDALDPEAKATRRSRISVIAQLGDFVQFVGFSLKPIFTDEKSDIAYNLGVRAIVSYFLKQVLDKT